MREVDNFVRSGNDDHPSSSGKTTLHLSTEESENEHEDKDKNQDEHVDDDGDGNEQEGGGEGDDDEDDGNNQVYRFMFSSNSYNALDTGSHVLSFRADGNSGLHTLCLHSRLYTLLM
ncbi:hypothetical protein Godav_010472 [Gossypium davidsonii]|uniref:Uncharacterized protein n=1 Tax=Gossypium davidsonii TaxID=34287 RepID=A0A7J8SGP1_GOSDV|nr:hypothetical protein [Gossypium davidsonii]